MLAADLLGGIPGGNDTADAALGGGISTLATPVITVPANQSTTEGAALLFSPSTGRGIRVDAPGLGAGALRVDISALESMNLVTPVLSFGTTAGLTVTGNGANVFQLQGTLANINASLASLAFYAPDNGDFSIDLVATDPNTGENDSASIDILALNVAPQVNIPAIDFADEGSVVKDTVELSDPGIFDSPQMSWTVSHRGVAIASGAGPEVQFLAAADGEYELTVAAVDKDGGMTSATRFIGIRNVTPTVDLNGVMHNGVVDLTVVIEDPGRELFFVEIYWTGGATTAETIFTSERVLSVRHQYTPEELAQAGELTIAVLVADNKSFDRQTLQFREGAPVAAERPEFTAPPQETPPDPNTPPRPQLHGTTSQIVSADFGRAASHGTQAAPALHQFVLRIVGPDGKESESFPLPGEALADLPTFLTSLGAPDGHYRIYLITGDLERLVIDGHLRAGRIVDPSDETQSGSDFPRREVAAQGAPNQRDGIVIYSAAPASQNVAGRDIVSAASEASIVDSGHDSADSAPASAEAVAATDSSFAPASADSSELAVSSSTDSQQSDEHRSQLMLPMVGAAVVIGAASTVLCTTVSRQIDKDPTPRLFCKRARLTRKLARQRPMTARV